MKPKTILMLLLALILLGVAIGLYMYNKPRPDITKAVPEFVLPALDLSREFIANDSLAGVKYTGHTVQISGSIADIQADSVHGIILTLDDPMAGVRCAMDKVLVPLSEKNTLVKGTNVEVKGICAGFDEFFGVVVNRCVFAQPKK
ncbi:MAG: hypothetical protein U0T82_12575 [Bacteroidales bacterium]